MKRMGRARFGETAVSLGYVCREDVAKALKVQGFRKQKGQKVPRIGVLLERMGCMSADQILAVSSGCSNRPTASLRTIGTTASTRFAPALEPVRRLSGTASVQQALGWLGREEKKQPPAAKAKPEPREKPEAKPPPKPKPKPEPRSKKQRAVEAVRSSEPTARPARAVESELQRLRETISRLTLRLAQVEAESEGMRCERDTFCYELERMTHAMIFKEDLIEALRHQVRRLGS